MFGDSRFFPHELLNSKQDYMELNDKTESEERREIGGDGAWPE